MPVRRLSASVRGARSGQERFAQVSPRVIRPPGVVIFVQLLAGPLPALRAPAAVGLNMVGLWTTGARPRRWATEGFLITGFCPNTTGTP